MNAYDRMMDFNKKNPDAKDVYKRMQQWHIANTPENGMFCPSKDLYLMTPRLAKLLLKSDLGHEKFAEISQERIDLLSYFWSLTVFGAWRNTLGIYRIDPEIYNQILLAPIPKDTPSSVFSRLPEWCVYIEFPADNFFVGAGETSTLVDGFWAYFDVQNIKGKFKDVLNIVLNTQSNTNSSHDALQPLQILIDDNLTVEQSLSALYDHFESDNTDVFAVNAMKKQELGLISTCLALLLWLCAEEPDISNIRGEPISAEQMRLPKYTRNKKTGAFVPPNQPIIYNIGKRLGGEVRQFNEQHGHSDSRISSRKRPHIRRGHWHGVWKGAGQDKQFSVYWQPAIFVNTKL